MRTGILFISALVLDQISKIIIRQTMVIGQSLRVIGQIVRITYVENPGIAFGIRINNTTFFTILSILASLGVFIYLITHRKEGMGVTGSLALILGGAVGNLIDRLLYRQVVDFIDVGIRDVRWPVFNVADSAVVVGMFLLFFFVLRNEKRKDEKLQEL